jgi:hypothetical protein
MSSKKVIEDLQRLANDKSTTKHERAAARRAIAAIQKSVIEDEETDDKLDVVKNHSTEIITSVYEMPDWVFGCDGGCPKIDRNNHPHNAPLTWERHDLIASTTGNPGFSTSAWRKVREKFILKYNEIFVKVDDDNFLIWGEGNGSKWAIYCRWRPGPWWDDLNRLIDNIESEVEENRLAELRRIEQQKQAEIDRKNRLYTKYITNHK